MTTLLVPIKALGSAKSRLGVRLSAAEREALCMEMLEHVVRQSAATKAIERLVLLSPCPTIHAWARRERLEALLDPPGAQSLAAVVDHGIARVRGASDGPVVVLMGDLPTLSAADLQGMVCALGTTDVVLAPDAAEAGTNGLGLSASTSMPTCFGRSDSFHAHHARCRSMGYRAVAVRSAGLAFDVDTAVDLDAYLRVASRALATSAR